MPSSPADILVFGAGGQLGRSLLARAPGRLAGVGRDRVDLEDPAGRIDDVIGSSGAAAVINAAAWTQVDLAETEPDRAWAVNVEAPRRMAEACARRGLPFLHVSTDYVFDGGKTGAWVEDDATGPLNVYGRTKLAGEQAVLAAAPDSLVVRTSWVVSEFGANFVRTMLRLADRPELKIVGDQRGVPTDADALAVFLLGAAVRMTKASAPGHGLLHFRNAGEAVSWAGFAEVVFETAGGPRPVIEPISTAEYGAPAARPENSELSIERLRTVWGYEPPHWRDGLNRIVTALRTES